MPKKQEEPPLTLTPDERVGVEAVDTTKGEPALDGVLKAKAKSSPL